MNTPEPAPEHPARYDGFAVHVPAPQPTPSDCRQGGQIALRGNETAITGYSQVDDFNAASSAGDLGPNWTQVYEGDGSGFMRQATNLQSIRWKQPEFSDGLTFYGSMPDSQGHTVGAKLRHDSTCTGCGKRFAKGDCITAELAPDMGGTFHHTDCDDPTLAKVSAWICISDREDMNGGLREDCPVHGDPAIVSSCAWDRGEVCRENSCHAGCSQVGGR